MGAGRTKTKRRIEFGDFQTPRELSGKICALLERKGIHPASILEPTCGTGSFLVSACEVFPTAQAILGIDINESYIASAKTAMSRYAPGRDVQLIKADFFELDWDVIIERLPDPLLVIGNLPWVTNSELGSLQSGNVPLKSNFQGYRGLDAVTGKSNFDISEWMLVRLLEELHRRPAVIAMLCKTAVARKVLSFAWRKGKGIHEASLHRFDAQRFFGASVDACLLLVEFGISKGNQECRVFSELSDEALSGRFGVLDGYLIADLNAYERHKSMIGPEQRKWRSGVKHDCSSVMELIAEGSRYRNGLGELCELEPDYLYPLIKGSDLGRTRPGEHRRFMLVPQRTIGEDTSHLAFKSPKTWNYLVSHGDLLDKRSSSIYKGRPRFSVFGVGEYTFSPWKIAISALHKKLEFVILGPVADRPVVLDDTCYFLPCVSQQEAELLAALLNSDIAREFYSAFVFWDAKRPISIEILQHLSLSSLAHVLGYGEKITQMRPNQMTLVM